MRILGVLVLAVALAPTGATQASPTFEGRWHLVHTTVRDAPESLKVLQPPTPEHFILERGYASGVKSELYWIGPARRGFYAARRMGPSLVLTRASSGNFGATAVSVGPKHEEIWTLLPGDVLNIDATDIGSGVRDATQHSTYARVPLPDVVPSQNLLENPDADAGGAGWIAVADAKVEPCGSSPCFTLRKLGNFSQTVLLPPSASGKYVALVGWGATEQINPDGAITGLPSIYGMITVPGPGPNLTHLQGQQLLGRLRVAGEWTKLAGVFPVPAGALRIDFQLHQASARGTAADGSATRFDHLGVFVFSSETDARDFIAGWKER